MPRSALSDFIREHLEDILADWEAFAGTLRPASLSLSREELRNTAGEILGAIADDMESDQSSAKQRRKSRGEISGLPVVDQTARIHASDRFAELFTLNQLVAEYRALRASVVRRWRKNHLVQQAEMDQLIRFDEAVDQSLSEAIRWYDKRSREGRGLLLGVLGHDLRNPLAAIALTADILRNDALTDDERVLAANRLEQSSRRMTRLIDDLLDFARLRFGDQMPISRERVDLVSVCRSVMDEVKATHPRATFRLSAARDAVGDWDAARLAQMLSNLLLNAVEHGESGNVRVTIDADDRFAWVAVHNDGPVIPDHHLRAIFHPFVTGDQDEDRGADDGREGTGLGLYIAQQIVEAHGGTIEATSTEKEGTSFAVRLPRTNLN